MSYIKVDFFTKEEERKVIKFLNLPRDVFEKKIVGITDTLFEETGRKIISLHYNVEKIENLSNEGYSELEIGFILECRGIQFDLEENRIRVKSYSYTSSINVNLLPENGLLELFTKDGFKTPKHGNYTEFKEGTLLRIYNVDGRVFGSTHRKCNVTNSFFCDSDYFDNIFLEDQNVFPTFESIYDSGMIDSNVVLIFILNNDKLLLNTRKKHEVNKVIFLSAHSSLEPMNSEFNTIVHDYIEEANKKVTKPIEIQKLLTPAEANSILSGDSDFSISFDVNKGSKKISETINSNPDYINIFRGGDKIIYKCEFGIFTLTPSSCYFRQNIIQGKYNINKIYTDLIANYDNPESNYMLKVCYSMDDLKDIIEKVERNINYNLSDYTPIPSENPHPIVLTNLFFSVPIYRMKECLSAHNAFGENINSSIKYMIRVKNEMFESISNNSFESYKGIRSVGSKFKKYLSSNLPKCFKKQDISSAISFPESYWHTSIIDLYEEIYILFINSEGKKEKQNYLTDLAIISMIANAKGDVLYAFFTYEDKCKKEAAAHEKSRLKASGSASV
jgi:hypothetical protein